MMSTNEKKTFLFGYFYYLSHPCMLTIFNMNCVCKAKRLNFEKTLEICHMGQVYNFPVYIKLRVIVEVLIMPYFYILRSPS